MVITYIGEVNLKRIVEKPINNPAGIAKLAIIVASLIPYIIFKRWRWLCLVVVLNKNCLVALLWKVFFRRTLRNVGLTA